MKISWPKGMERWKAVLDRYRYALLVIAAGVLLLLLPTGESRPPAEAVSYTHLTLPTIA